MDRAIKFRAWDRKAKAMFPVHKLNFGKINNELESLYGVDIHHKDSDFYGDVSYGGSVSKQTGNPLLPRFEIMQFTGLEDINGKEIFEGDIAEDEDGKKFHIRWGISMNGFFAHTTDVHSNAYSSYHIVPKLKWVGTIHENPELLDS